jgi:hypothetical protein
MEISFCDRCGASIPRMDLERRAAGRWGGDLLCAPCRRTERRRAFGRFLLLPLALGVAAAVGAAAAVAVLSPRLRSVETAVVDLGRQVDSAPGPGADSAEEIRGLRELATRQSTEFTAFEGELRKEMRGIARSVETVAGRLDDLAAAIRAVKSRVAAAEAGPAAPAPDAASGGAPPAKAAPGLDLASWLPLLDDDDPGVRFSALVKLEGSRDERVEKRTREMLEDADPDIRVQAARMVGARHDLRAVPALTKLLEDDNLQVRSVAYDALRGIAGPIEGYDPMDPAEARAAALKPWLESHR